MAAPRLAAAALLLAGLGGPRLVEAQSQYDCTVTGANPVELWDGTQKAWCCAFRSVGCATEAPTLVPPQVATPELTSWPVRCSKDCNGRNTCAQMCRGDQQQTRGCGPQAQCPVSALCPKGTMPQDCTFSDWTQWSNCDDCTGICTRQRVITSPNRCGGKPCEGALEDSKACPVAANCEVRPQDCTFTAWSLWGKCGATLQCQRERSRAVDMPAMHGGKPCQGLVTETEACGSECKAAVNCQLSEWMQWSACSRECGGGEQMRLRTIMTRAENGGRTCNDPMSQKQGCNTDPCKEAAAVDCELGEWQDWSGCMTGDQKMRHRPVVTLARGAGQACETPLTETQGCGAREQALEAITQCRLGEWSDWELCDRTCGGGQTFRTREVVRVDGYLGPCDGSLEASQSTMAMETAPCNLVPCGLDKEPCRVAPWSEWGVCSATCGMAQQQRTRTILAQAQAGGIACKVPLEETRGCSSYMQSCDITDCEWGDWAPWSECSSTCGGTGQRNRTKPMRVPATVGGLPCPPANTEEVEPCGYGACVTGSCVDGRWADWGGWTQCSSTCSGGYRWRTRQIAQEANECGQPPTGPATEAASCNDDVECVPRAECEFTDWSRWSSCSSQCKGVRTRKRELKVLGDSCGTEEDGQAAMLEEVEGCSGPKDGTAECTNAMQTVCNFDHWGPWTQCSASCGGGQSVRQRQVRQKRSHSPPQLEGATTTAETTATGTTTTAPIRMALDLDADLVGSTILQAYQRRLFGEVQRGEDPYNCTEGADSWQWGWSEEKKQYCCTAHPPIGCEGPFLANQTAVSSGGKKDELPKVDVSGFCEGPIVITRPCNNFECNATVIDCAYGDWSEWSKCTKCGGQRFRQRPVAQEASNGGKSCERKAIEQTGRCPRSCGDKVYYCVWSDWQPLDTCSSTCGSGTQRRSRVLELTDKLPAGADATVALAANGKECSGELLEYVACGEGNPSCADTCQPQDCELSEWSEWSAPTCEGLCRRERTILTPNNDCGKPCSGSLNSTQQCPADCSSKDCVLSDWTDWTPCNGELDQRYRFRTILQLPAFNGKPCHYEPLNMTGSCMTGPDAPVDCQFAEWAAWGACSATCGPGQQERVRAVLNQASNNGNPCTGVVRQAMGCDLGQCLFLDGVGGPQPQDCQYGEWSEWSACQGETDRQVYRSRTVDVPAANRGTPCQGVTRETQGCQQESVKKRDCNFTDWSSWSPCPVTCGGGQTTRSRHIQEHARGGGRQCEGGLVEATACSADKCPGDTLTEECGFSDWSSWSDCSTTCGDGYATRNRKLTQPALLGAQHCGRDLQEVTKCQIVPCESAVDCVWGKWAAWSDCVPAPDVCGVGFKRRARDIEVFPSGGGQLCEPRVRDQVMPVADCQGQPQCCVNGQWADWEMWGACSATCGRGTRKRERKLAVQETWCGDPAPGSDTEHEGCEAEGCTGDHDCIFGDWAEWSPCSADCHGNQTRRRDIKVHALGAGAACAGPTVVVQRCNPAIGQKEPFSCESHTSAPNGPQDCLMAEWSDWSSCSATCQGGIQTRDRHIQIHPEKGGKSCQTALRETQGCLRNTPCFAGRVDCIWDHWTEWSECNSLDWRFRTRGIKQQQAAGGVACQGDVREIEPCISDGSNHTGFCPIQTYACQWGQWTSWSQCSTTCGLNGVRTRKRHLEVGAPMAPIDATQGKFSLPHLEAQALEMQPASAEERFAAFSFGFAGLSLLVLAVRSAQAGACALHRHLEPSTLEYDVVPQHP